MEIQPNRMRPLGIFGWPRRKTRTLISALRANRGVLGTGGPGSTQLPQTLHSTRQGIHVVSVEKRAGAVLTLAFYPLSVSVSLFSILFKSLSPLRTVSILSTECMTVVWCLPPNCRPISGNDASVRCLARYIAICRG